MLLNYVPCSNNNFKIKTCTIKYNIHSFPNYLMFILDINSNQLSSLSEFILNIFKDSITIINNDVNYNYSFIYGICYKDENHFTICFNKIE